MKSVIGKCWRFNKIINDITSDIQNPSRTLALVAIEQRKKVTSM